MRAILVSVDYSDLLAVTLPYNRHHFTEIMVVTSPEDKATIKVANEHSTWLWITNAFYENGAIFNKWLALEQGLDVFGRYGLLCVMDADVLWPKVLPKMEFEFGCLYTPRRRMVPKINMQVPAEVSWSQYPLHRQEVEFAGYSQIFHAEDPVLDSIPWHQTNWRHAGGADSFFQNRWPTERKIRPPFEVLHLGPAGKNWCGRATPYLNGVMPEHAERRTQQVQEFIQGRVAGPTRFDKEKIL